MTDFAQFFKPNPVSYTILIPIDMEFGKFVTVWPGQQVIMRIERIRLSELGLRELGGVKHDAMG